MKKKHYTGSGKKARTCSFINRESVNSICVCLQELTLLGYDLTHGDVLSELGHKVSYASHNGRLEKVSSYLVPNDVKPCNLKLWFGVFMIFNERAN